MSASRISWADYAKGLSIILVVIHHSIFHDVDSSLYNPTINYLNDLLVKVRMPLFFFVSALFVHKGLQTKWKDFINTKILNLFYLFVLWSIIRYILIVIPEYILLDAPKSELYSILHIFIEPPSFLWFVYALLIFMIVTKLTKSTPFIALGIAIALFLSVDYIGIGTDNFLGNRLIYFYPFYLLGYIFSEQAKRIFNNFNYFYMLIPIMYFILLVNVNDVWSSSRIGLLVLTLGGLFTGITISCLFSKLRTMKWMGYIGANTLSIYLMHFLPLAALKLTLPILIPNKTWLAIAIMAVLGVVLPLLAMVVIKKLNMNWLIRLPYRQQR